MISKFFKKRLLPLVLVGATVASLASCSLLPDPNGQKLTNVKIDDLMVKQENQNGAGQTVKELSSIKGVPSAISGNLLLTVEEEDPLVRANTVWRVYNLDLGKELVTVTGERQVGFISKLLQNGDNAEGIYYIINENIMYIFNSDGSQAIAAYIEEDGSFSLKDTLNGFSFNGTEYYVKDGTVVYEGDNPLESDYFNAAVEYLDRRYYVIPNQMVFAFDNLGKPLYEFHRPSYAEDAHIFVLSNGNIFIQYTYETIEGETYDYIRNNKQHKIVSILVNVERGTVSEPVIGYLVTDLENAFTDEDFYERYTDRVSNVAKIIDIANKRIDDNVSARYVVLSDSLMELFAMRDVVSGALDIIRISADRNLVKTASGSLLVAGDCTVIGQLNNYRYINEKYIVTSGKIYDHDLKALLDLVAGGYTFHAGIGDSIILSKIVNEKPCLYLYQGSEPVYICELDKYVACFEGYAVKSDSGYRYYDEKGFLLVTTPAEIVWMDYTEEADGRFSHVGYARDNNGNVTYYQLHFTMVDTLE